MKFSLKNNISAVIGAVLFFLLLFGIGDEFNQKNKHLVQWYLNKVANDNSQNWTCHNYAYNLMNTAEPNAIFMTEGGDNQVFSLLYFSYVERKRPDIDFYDQKGNVFPRLYGDLMNTMPDDITMIRQLRDFQFLSTGRPVYLTWQRAEIENLQISKIKEQYLALRKKNSLRGYAFRVYELDSLEGLQKTLNNLVPKATFDMKFKNNTAINEVDLKYTGPWFLKQYGLLYKALPLRYVILEMLTATSTKKVSLSALQQYTQAQTKVNVTQDDLQNYVKELIKNVTQDNLSNYVKELINEGWITKTGNLISLKKEPAFPFAAITSQSDYWNNYVFDYTNVANASAWDYLTREIIINYHLHLARYYQKSIDFLNIKIKATNSLTERKKLAKQIQQYTSMVPYHYTRSIVYGKDNPISFINKANYWYNQGDIPTALQEFSNSTKNNYALFQPYINIAQIIFDNYVPQATNEQQEKQYLEQVKNNFMEARRRLKRSIEVKEGNLKNLAQSKDYQFIQNHINTVEGYIAIPTLVLLAQIAKARASNSVADYKTLAEYYIKRYQFQEALAAYDIIIRKQPTEIIYWIEKYQIASRFNTQIAISILEQVIAKYELFSNPKPTKHDMLEALAIRLFQTGNGLLNNRNWQAALISYNKALFYAQTFIQVATPLAQQNNDIKNRAISMERNIKVMQQSLSFVQSIITTQ